MEQKTLTFANKFNKSIIFQEALYLAVFWYLTDAGVISATATTYTLSSVNSVNGKQVSTVLFFEKL